MMMMMMMMSLMNCMIQLTATNVFGDNIGLYSYRGVYPSTTKALFLQLLPFPLPSNRLRGIALLGHKW